ncbi:MAG: hypothetical protein HOV81_12575 [Kofleriaceae bacterium]|nr:hypothetical protein [Kofleriaceae bacterium]
MSAALLREVVELTPLPPATTDVDELLAAFNTMYDTRRIAIAGLPVPLEDTEETRTLVCELASRDAAWSKALSDALATVGAARRNAGRLRSYAR